MGSGKAFESFGTTNSSFAIEPRATVFSMSGRSERPSAKKSLSESGLFFGLLAMSCRSSSSLHPTRKTPQAASSTPRMSEALIFIAHLGHIFRANTFEKLRGARQIKFCVAGFDADEEGIVCGALEAGHGEERTMRLRELVQSQHSEHGKRACAEKGGVKRDWKEGGP